MELVKTKKKLEQYLWNIKSTNKPRIKLSGNGKIWSIMLKSERWTVILKKRGKFAILILDKAAPKTEIDEGKFILFECNIFLTVPNIKDRPVIDYDKLRLLCDAEKNRDENDEESRRDFHNMFMKNYTKLFVKPEKRIGLPIHSYKTGNKINSLLSISQKATGQTTGSEKKAILPLKDQEFSHDIKDYLQLYHKKRASNQAKVFHLENLKILRKYLRKLPFERTSVENDKICTVLKTIPVFSENIPLNVLKELCAVAQLEVWKECDFTIFGNTGLYLILKGSVQTESRPYLMLGREESTLSSVSFDIEGEEKPADKATLNFGLCFGTLKRLEGKEADCRELSVATQEINCEFMKISTSDYKRVIEQIKQKEHTEKLNLVLSCSQYSFWPRQPLLQVANLIEWIKYSSNTVLVSEGYKSPFIAFIKSGECHVLRRVEVIETLKNGQKKHKSKQVVIGKLGTSNSFAELSVLLKEPMSCSIVTASAVELGIIKPEKLDELDEVTVQLLKQSNKHLFGDLAQDDIHTEYMHQELKREWNEFKHHVIVDVINTRGIKPGYGKWSK